MERDRRAIRQPADMRGDEGFPSARHRHRRLQMRAERQHVGTVATKFDRLRHEAARAPQKGRSAVDHRHHAIVGAGEDRPIMADDEIGDSLEFFARLVIVDDQRLAARIGARRDEREVLRRIAPGAILSGLPAAAWNSK